jgi:peptide/nickel transport system substrate-binding protein
LGVEMKISNLPAAVMWGEFWQQSQFDSVIVGSSYLIGADPDVTNRLHSRSIAAKGGRGSNNAQYANPEVDALLDKGARSFDPEARRSIYYRVQELVRRDLPFLPLYQNNAVQGQKKGISGVVPNGNTRTESWNALAWYWAS